MTGLQIDTSRMPAQNWSIAAQPVLRSSAASPSLAEARPQPTRSLSAEEAKIMPRPPSLEVQLFENAAQLKIMLSQIAMHLSTEWRYAIFGQLDSLLKLEDWLEDSSIIEASTFKTFVRFIIFSAPKRFPSLGVGLTGHVLAAWTKDGQKISVEFFPDDVATAIVVKQGTRGKETVAWRGHVVDLKLFIERFGGREALDE